MDESEVRALISRVEKDKDKREIHIPYSEKTGKHPDFEVEYVLLIDQELGPIMPSQGMKCDFLYEGDDPFVDGIHMIWPELLDEFGDVVLDKAIPAAPKGRATMWIVDPESRVKYHQPRIKVGLKGCWVVGSKKVANVTVTKILGLFDR